tara:strand:- start:1367 stop:1582 length:216 start_codon:yes stop_codon:yes gene_type:complete
MQLELGQLIIDTTGGCKDAGVVIEITTCLYGDPVYRIYWVCPRDSGGYTTTLTYSEEELEMEYSHCFEVIK